jgi:hypothetical protein
MGVQRGCSVSLLVLFSYTVILKEKRTPAHGQFSEKSPWQQDFSRLKLPVRASFLPTFFFARKKCPGCKFHFHKIFAKQLVFIKFKKEF